MAPGGLSKHEWHFLQKRIQRYYGFKLQSKLLIWHALLQLTRCTTQPLISKAAHQLYLDFYKCDQVRNSREHGPWLSGVIRQHKVF